MTELAGRFGIDVGRARIGVATNTGRGSLALPLETVRVRPDGFQRVVDLIREYEPEIVYVGLPLGMGGNETQSTGMARDFAQNLVTHVSAQIYLVDERLSTVSAQQQLTGVGKNVKQQKNIIDQQAAAIILQSAIDHEKVQGYPAGEKV